jgi:hypothetical protein
LLSAQIAVRRPNHLKDVMTFGPFLKTIRIATAVAALVCSAIPMSASADVVFQSVGNLGDTSKLTSPWCSGCGSSFRIFDQFTLNEHESINGFSVALYSPAPYWGSGMNFSVWTVGAGDVPGTQLFSQNLSNADFTTQAIRNDALIASTGKVTGLDLDAGNYYVSFYNPYLAVWGYNGGGGDLYQQGIGHYEGTSAGFTLSAAANQVPEPAGLALFAVAMACAMGARRRVKA